MGAWGFGVFENDDAHELLIQLRSAAEDGLEVLDEAFDAIPDDPGEFLEAPEASMVVAAAELVAAAGGRAGKGELPDDASRWLVAHPSPPGAALVRKAKAALTRVREVSELRDLWEDSDDFAAWLKVVDDIGKRLGKVASAEIRAAD